jgi:hypothetical protein
MKTVTLKIKEAQLLRLRHGADEIILTLGEETPFPNMGYDGTVKITVQTGLKAHFLQILLA